MSNAIYLRNSTVVFSGDEFDIARYAEIHRLHEVHPKKSMDLEVDDLFCWFLRENTEYRGDKVIIQFGQGASSHTWRDFAQTINFLKQFVKKEKKHVFMIADEDSRCDFSGMEIVFGWEYDRLLRVVNEE